MSWSETMLGKACAILTVLMVLGLVFRMMYGGKGED